jgi:hypothetical protein
MSFFILVKAKREDGRVLDETILEFSKVATQSKIEKEISLAQNSMAHYLNLKNLIFSYQYMGSERDAKKSQLWSVYGKGHYIYIK